MKISMIVARADNGVIGLKGGLAWNLPAELAYFKQVTMGHPIIMGRKTHDSIGRPLPGRLNLIVSRNPSYEAPGCTVVSSLSKALQAARATGTDEAFVIGGVSLYQEAESIADSLYLTEVHANPSGDVKLALDPASWSEISRVDRPADAANEHDISFVVLRKV